MSELDDILAMLGPLPEVPELPDLKLPEWPDIEVPDLPDLPEWPDIEVPELADLEILDLPDQPDLWTGWAESVAQMEEVVASYQLPENEEKQAGHDSTRRLHP